MDRAMRENQELLPLVAFGAAIIHGLAGAPLWMAASTGALYGAERLGALAPGDHAVESAGVFASRMGAVLLCYGIALALRLLGTSGA